jgi:hypothetical protein
LRTSRRMSASVWRHSCGAVCSVPQRLSSSPRLPVWQALLSVCSPKVPSPRTCAHRTIIRRCAAVCGGLSESIATVAPLLGHAFPLDGADSTLDLRQGRSYSHCRAQAAQRRSRLTLAYEKEEACATLDWSIVAGDGCRHCNADGRSNHHTWRYYGCSKVR